MPLLCGIMCAKAKCDRDRKITSRPSQKQIFRISTTWWLKYVSYFKNTHCILKKLVTSSFMIPPGNTNCNPDEDRHILVEKLASLSQISAKKCMRSLNIVQAVKIIILAKIRSDVT